MEEADSNRAKVTEPFPAGQNGGSPARRHPGAEPGYGPAAGAWGAGASARITLFHVSRLSGAACRASALLCRSVSCRFVSLYSCIMLGSS